MIVRLLVLTATLVLAFGAVDMIERRTSRRWVGLLPGVTLVTSEGCTLCPAVRSALRNVEVREVDVSTVGDVRSVPTVVVADSRGRVTLRRSGRSAITDAAAIIAAARLVA